MSNENQTERTWLQEVKLFYVDPGFDAAPKLFLHGRALFDEDPDVAARAGPGARAAPQAHLPDARHVVFHRDVLDRAHRYAFTAAGALPGHLHAHAFQAHEAVRISAHQAAHLRADDAATLAAESESQQPRIVLDPEHQLVYPDVADERQQPRVERALQVREALLDGGAPSHTGVHQPRRVADQHAPEVHGMLLAALALAARTLVDYRAVASPGDVVDDQLLRRDAARRDLDELVDRDERTFERLVARDKPGHLLERAHVAEPLGPVRGTPALQGQVDLPLLPSHERSSP